MRRNRRPAWVCAFVLCALAAAFPRPAAAEKDPAQEASFAAAAAVYRGSSSDPAAAQAAFARFLSRYPHGARAADAEFSIAESLFAQALDSWKQKQSIFSNAPPASSLPDSSIRDLTTAQKDYSAALKNARDDGLRATASYRLGEIAYALKDWPQARKRFEQTAEKWPRSYMSAGALLGLAYSDMAAKDFTGTQEALGRIQKLAPDAMNSPDAAFIRGILALRAGDFSRAKKSFSAVQTQRARYYLGRTDLAWGKPLLAAAIFEKLSQDCPIPGLRAASSFYLGDCFFASKDYDGASEKYSDFVERFPFSPLKVAALYRIGGAAFEKEDYGQARLSFGSLISQYPEDYYAAYARYFIGESYLAAGDLRQALFAYSDLLSSKGTLLKPQALYRLAWVQQALGDIDPAVKSCRDFLSRFPDDSLSGNVSLIMANSLARLKHYPEAISAYERILDSAPEGDLKEEALFLMLKLQYDQGLYGPILTSDQFLLGQLPASRSRWRGFAYLIVAETNLRQARLDEARTIYQMILKVYSNDPAAVYAQDGLAWCDELSGQDKAAVADRKKLKGMLDQSASTSTLSAINNLGIADSFYAQKDYNDAYDFYQKFADQNPDSPAFPTALYRAGSSLYHLNYYSQAIDAWRTLLAKAPGSPQAKKAAFELADTLFRAQKYPEAEKSYEDILAHLPVDDPQAGLCDLRLAQIAYQAGNDSQALAQVKALVSAIPQSDQVDDALNLAETIFDRDPKLDFLAFFQELVQDNPHGLAAGNIQFRIARRLYEAKNYAAAAQELERFSVDYADNPSLPKAQILLGECDFQLGRFSDAAAAYERLVENFPKSKDAALALFKMGSSYYQIKNYGKAASAYKALLSQYPSSAYANPARFNLALAYKDAGLLDAAEAVEKQYAASSPDAAQKSTALWEIFAIEHARKDYPEAIKTLKAILASASGDAALEASYQIGSVEKESGDAAAAQKAWEQTAAMRPANAPYRLQALVKLSQIYEKESDWEKAAAVYRDLERHADSPDMIQAAKERLAIIQNKPGYSPGPGKE
ncbi:MAG: tetratricopeptide repeat protein [Elusimicrobiota bacterium]